MRRCLNYILPLLLVLCMAMPVFAAPSFHKVSAWAKTDMQKAYDLGWVTDGLLEKAQNPISRVEFAAMAVSFYRSFTGKSGVTMKETPYYDTKDKNVAFITEQGIMPGLTDTLFGVGGEISREEFAYFLKNLLESSDVRFPETSGMKLNFKDADRISEAYREAVTLLSDAGIIQGYGGQFYPFTNVTVEQAVSMFLKAKETFRVMPVQIGKVSLRIGDTKASALAQLGNPQRIDMNEFGFERYLYYSDPQNLIIIGIKDEKVAEIFTNAKNLSFAGMTKETKADTVDFLRTKSGAVGGNIPSYESEATVYFDYYNGNQLDGVYLRSKGLTLVSSDISKSVATTLLDVINSGRAQSGVTNLQWSDAAAYTAFRHALELAHSKMTTYTNKLNETPFERMTNYGIRYVVAAETISDAQKNCFSAYYDMRSNAGARGNLLEKDLSMAGIASYRKGEGMVFVVDMYLPS